MKNNSLFLFPSSCKLRKLIVILIDSAWFDYFILSWIFANSINLAMYDYSKKSNYQNRMSINDVFEILFSIIFLIEATLKIIGMGFIFHKNSYLRESWNILDFIVVLVSLVEFVPNVPSLKSLRVLRVLRPLISINAIPNMRMLVSTLFMSIPQLWSVLVFLLFVFLLFGIMGINQYTGQIYSQWRITQKPENATFWAKTTPLKRCGGDQHWENGTFCGNPTQYGISLEDDGVRQNPTIIYGITNFNNLFEAMITIFQVITMEGWTNIMYMVMDTNTSFLTVPYFCLIIIIGSFFLLNLILAVIMRVFTQNDELEKIKYRKKKILEETK